MTPVNSLFGISPLGGTTSGATRAVDNHSTGNDTTHWFADIRGGKNQPITASSPFQRGMGIDEIAQHICSHITDSGIR